MLEGTELFSMQQRMTRVPLSALTVYVAVNSFRLSKSPVFLAVAFSWL